MSKNKIAVLYEGMKTERLLFLNINKLFLEATVVPICLPFDMSVYMLWNKMKTDDFETDIIELARECSDIAEKVLIDLKRDDFSEVYLFLDHDAHSWSQTSDKVDANDVIFDMLNTFDNETENGKLYISYPMIEAIRDLLRGDNCYRRCCADINKLSHYKEQSSKSSDFRDFRKYDIPCWKILCKHAVKKANCIINSSYTKPTYDNFRNELGQIQIFQRQREKYISNNKVAILSGIPLFLLEYHKEKFWSHMCEE